MNPTARFVTTVQGAASHGYQSRFRSSMHGGARSERVARAGEEGKCAEMGGGNKYVALGHPGVELRANLKSISNICSLW